MTEMEWRDGDDPKLRALLGYALRDHVNYQDGRHSEAPTLLFADYDYEVGDGTCGVSEDGKRCNEPAIVYTRADALMDALARAEAAELQARYETDVAQAAIDEAKRLSARLAEVEKERDEALRRRDEWREKAKHYDTIRDALRAKTAGKDSRTLGRAMLGAAKVEAEERAESLSARLAEVEAELSQRDLDARASQEAADSYRERLAEVKAERDKLREALEPFSVYAGSLFAANFNRNDVVTQQAQPGAAPVSLLFDAFLAARAALTDAKEGREDG